MSRKSVVEEFVSTLEYYMDYYGLYSIDIKKLLKATTDIVKDIKNGKNGPTITKAEDISQIFGLTYYKFANPEISPLPKEELPVTTIAAIDERNESGPPESRGSYNSLNLKDFIIDALADFKDRKEFLPSEVYEVLPEELKSKLKSATRVTGLFSNELKDLVEKTNNSLQKSKVGRPEGYYRVVSLEDKK